MNVTTELLTRYLLDDLAPAERAELETHISTQPEVAARCARLQTLLAALHSEATDSPVPPPNLALNAIAHTAEYLVSNGLYRPEPEPEVTPRRSRRGEALRRWVADPVFFGWGRANVAVAFTIGLLAVGLGLGAVAKMRQDYQLRICQNNLHTVHTALMEYSDTHSGRFPQVGTAAVPVAASFAMELANSGHLGTPELASCPSVDATPSEPQRLPANFAYTLGYRTPTGQLVGYWRPGDTSNTTGWTPIAADPPSAPHARGQNVLYAGGTVRFTVSPTVGVDGDNIYTNEAGLVRAGLHRLDTALGTGPDIP